MQIDSEIFFFVHAVDWSFSLSFGYYLYTFEVEQFLMGNCSTLNLVPMKYLIKLYLFTASCLSIVCYVYQKIFLVVFFFWFLLYKCQNTPLCIEWHTQHY